MRKLNRTAKVWFYTARRRNGDNMKLSTNTGYSVSHISNILAGRRKVNDTIANAMYSMSRNRMKNSEKV